MKNKTLILSLSLSVFLLALATIFTSCKKDDKKAEEETPAPVNNQSNTEKIQDKSFKVTAMVISAPPLTMDMFGQMKDCEKDNTFTFKTAGIYVEDEGATKCNTMDNQQQTGTWKWVNNETEMTVVANGQTWTWKILTNDGTILKTSVEKDTMGIKATLITTFTKQ